MTKCGKEKKKQFNEEQQDQSPLLRDVKKDIKGSGKAAFPGEKVITDESPRMEEDEQAMLEDLERKEVGIVLELKNKLKGEDPDHEIIDVEDEDEEPILEMIQGNNGD